MDGMVRNVFLLFIATLIFGVSIGYFFGYGHGYEEGALLSEAPITSFEDCAAAGYPVMESYPEQCRTPDGILFVRELPQNTGNPATPPSERVPGPEEIVACPMDARICPDGSAVGRGGPNCEFDPCPGE